MLFFPPDYDLVTGEGKINKKTREMGEKTKKRETMPFLRVSVGFNVIQFPLLRLQVGFRVI